MMSARAVALSAALLSVASLGCASSAIVCPHQGGPAWTELGSPHFVVKTDLPRGQARALAVDFESLHAALGRMMSRQERGPGEKVEVVVFAGRDEFHAFDAANDTRSAYYADRLGLDLEPSPTVVMYVGDDERGRETFLHELTHRFLHERYADLPMWVNEGLAQFFETFRVKDRRGFLGAPWQRPSAAVLWTDHYATPSGQLVPLAYLPSSEEVMGADRARFYGEELAWTEEKQWRVSMYYAGAFRLVHMMMNGPKADYRARFAAYLEALGRGVHPRQAQAVAFAGVDVGALERDYRAYVAAPRLAEREIDLGPPSPPPAVTARPMSDGDVHVLWSRLRPRDEEHRVAVEVELQEAVAQDPASPSSTEARLRRAVLFASQRRMAEAEQEITAALSARPDDPRTLMGRLRVYDAYDEAAFRCGEPSPVVDAAVDRLSRAAVTGAELNVVATYLEGHGRADLALRFAEEAVRRSPLCWACEDVRSLLLLQKGDLPGALAANARARALLPERSTDRRPAAHRRMIEAVSAAAAGGAPGPEAGEGGHLPDASVDAVMRGSADALQCCYHLGHGADRGSRGRVVLGFTVKPDGSTGDAAVVESTLSRPEVDRCLVRQALKMRFPAPRGGPVPVRYGLQFAPPPSR